MEPISTRSFYGKARCSSTPYFIRIYCINCGHISECDHFTNDIFWPFRTCGRVSSDANSGNIYKVDSNNCCFSINFFITFMVVVRIRSESITRNLIIHWAEGKKFDPRLYTNYRSRYWSGVFTNGSSPYTNPASDCIRSYCSSVNRRYSCKSGFVYSRSYFVCSNKYDWKLCNSEL